MQNRNQLLKATIINLLENINQYDDETIKEALMEYHKIDKERIVVNAVIDFIEKNRKKGILGATYPKIISQTLNKMFPMRFFPMTLGRTPRQIISAKEDADFHENAYNELKKYNEGLLQVKTRSKSQQEKRKEAQAEKAEIMKKRALDDKKEKQLKKLQQQLRRKMAEDEKRAKEKQREQRAKQEQKKREEYEKRWEEYEKKWEGYGKQNQQRTKNQLIFRDIKEDIKNIQTQQQKKELQNLRQFLNDKNEYEYKKLLRKLYLKYHPDKASGKQYMFRILKAIDELKDQNVAKYIVF
jgi:hypothetical protein